MRILTDEQVKSILKNKNVRRCSNKSIRYKKKFKETAMELYNKEGLAAVEIFKLAGFDLSVIGKRMPNKLMNQWNTAKRPRIASRLPFRVKPSVEITKGDNIRRLKNRVAYLEAENGFLAKLRARKRK